MINGISLPRIFMFMIATTAVTMWTFYHYYRANEVPLIWDKRARGSHDQANLQVKNCPNRTLHPLDNSHVMNYTLCKLKVFDSIDKDMESRKQLPMCSFAHFRQVTRDTCAFPQEGKWVVKPKAVFYPQSCQFADILTTSDWKKCLKTFAFRRILFTGDSNSAHFHGRFITFLQEQNWTCGYERAGQRNAHASVYFHVPGLNMTRPYRYPARCYMRCSRQMTCYRNNTGEEPQVLHLEYINERLIYDTRFLDYLVEYYFPYFGFPDLWFFLPPFLHTKNVPLARTQNGLNYFHKVSDTLIPSRIKKVIFIPVTLENMEKVPRNIYRSLRPFFPRIVNMNRILFDTFVDKLVNPDSGIYGFFDMAELCCPLRGVKGMYQDGAHLKGFWVKIMLDYILQALCNTPSEA